MPKEVIKENVFGNAQIEVRWGDLTAGYVGIGVDRGDKFTFVNASDVDNDGNPIQFTGLHILLDNREQVDALIKVLHKAKRKTF